MSCSMPRTQKEPLHSRVLGSGWNPEKRGAEKYVSNPLSTDLTQINGAELNSPQSGLSHASSRAMERSVDIEMVVGPTQPP